MSALLERLLAASRTLESLELDAAGRVIAVNDAFARHSGRRAPALVGAGIDELVVAHEGARLLAWCRGSDGTPDGGAPINFVDATGSPYTLWCHVECHDGGVRLVGEPDIEDTAAADELLRLNNELATLSRENTRRRREAEQAQAELGAALEELRTSYWHLQKIQEVMPICMRCGKLKADGSNWKSVVEYFLENRIFLSHGFCPGCAAAEMRAFGIEEDE